MASRTPPRLLTAVLFLALTVVAPLFALTSPKEHFGFTIGDDYHLANYTQTEAYFRKLAAESNRVRLVDIGLTEENRRQLMLIVTAPGNFAKLERYREISQKLARAEGLSDDQARALAAEGKAVVWIDGGLHATETVGTHQLIESVWTFASRDDPETRRILEDVIILFAHANPDGQELISDWYLRRPKPEERVVDLQPRLYHKYAGHDNNRDFFMMNLRESANIARQLYVEWLPQIVYNHHQSAPAGTVIAGPPYRDPFNYVFDPLLVTSIDAIGAAMNNRFNAEGKPGATQRRGAVFSTWWNGGLRTTPYFHNQIGILTEIIGSPTPMEVPLLPERQLPSGDLPNPVAPQTWRYRQSIEYSLSANYAILDYASRHRDELLYNIYRMGRASIERGSRDHWTLYPGRIDAMRRAYEQDRKSGPENRDATAPDRLGNHFRPGIPARYYDQLKKPELRDARGYILPADQADFATATTFVNALLKGGVAVERATAAFTVSGSSYPSGSYIVKTAQAFRPHVIDLFEPQDHPNDFRYEGGPPIAPYDSAGWTLAYLMGVKFDRVLEGFDGPFERIPWGELQAPPAGRTATNAPAPPAGYLLSPQSNHAFIAVNRLLKAGAGVFRLPDGLPGDAAHGPGAWYVPASAGVRELLARGAGELGLDATAVRSAPAGPRVELLSQRIALWDTYGGSMPSGWTRWLLERFEFPFEVVYPRQIDAGNLRARYDVIVFVTGAIPPPKSLGRPSDRSYWLPVPKPEDVPAEFRGWLGKLTEENSIPALKQFLAEGGTIITIGSSTALAYHLGLPVRNALLEQFPDGTEKPLPAEKFYVPGSVLRVRIDPAQPLAWGMQSDADVYYDNSPVFRLAPEAAARGVTPVAWFATEKPLRSGWAWGEGYLADGVVALEARVGSGKLHLLGPEVAFRGQTHGTFKLLFNALHGHTPTDN
ncbi:MAG TPA: M14 metallopeptidase family protein [Opitutaceae bacterium]